MDDAASGATNADAWSAVAAEWSRLWGGVARPAWDAVLAASGVAAGTRVLDVGCGSGELLAHLDALGMSAAGVDPASQMLAVARANAPAADLRDGDAEHVPWPDASFDLVVAVNALELADDVDAALAELVRVTMPGGCIAIVNWADARLNDLDRLEAALAREWGEEPLPDGDLRLEGGHARLLAALEPVATGIVDVPWHAADDATLVAGVMLGEDDAVQADLAPVVLEAARPFRLAGGGYRLVNRFRYGVARTPI